MHDAELIDVISSAQRAEAQAASRRLAAIGVLVDRHADPNQEDSRDRFALDRWDEVAAKVQARYDGILDRVALYLPFRPGVDTERWQRIVRAFT